jgi:uncharacterized protein YecE (DUF72 family)
MSKGAQVHVGTSGWNYDHWRGRFYPHDMPDNKWFEHYAGVFRTVEINNTFYHLPELKTFNAWNKQAPHGFVYAVKASRFITHMKKLKDPKKPLARFLQRARRLGSHLGPVLYQLPPHWKPDVERLTRFCEQLPDDLTHVIEFRKRAWLQQETYAALAGAGRPAGGVLSAVRKLRQRLSGKRPTMMMKTWLPMKIISHLKAASMNP